MDKKDEVLEATVRFNRRLIAAVKDEITLANISGHGFSLIQAVMLKVCRTMDEGGTTITATPNQETLDKYR